jgi:hypothetical protein
MHSCVAIRQIGQIHQIAYSFAIAHANAYKIVYLTKSVVSGLGPDRKNSLRPLNVHASLLDYKHAAIVI